MDKKALSERDICTKFITPALIHLIWRWWRMGDKEQVKAWIKQVIANDEWVVKFAANLPSRSYQSGGEGGSKVVWTFKRDTYKDAFDVDAVFPRLATLAANNGDAMAALGRLKAAETEAE
jgi:hypothetical protein